MYTPPKPPRVRIAPSPTGNPHVGTAYIALFNRALARRFEGQFILRIEDTDQARSRPEYEQMILESLRWLGLDWDEGPDVGGPHAPYRQSERKEIYGEYAHKLLEAGHAYKCFCSEERLEALRARQKAEKLAYGYDKHCLHLDAKEVKRLEESGKPYVIRFNMPAEGETVFADYLRGEISVPNKDTDDKVLLKSDGMPTYHLANVVDDHVMEVTHVIRAEEWIASMPLHWRMYEAFQWEKPLFCHMPLLRNENGSKISKRKNPVSLTFYRRIGVLPEALLNFLGLQGYSLGEDREFFSHNEFVESFDLERVKTTGPVFDLEKLKHIAGQHLRALSDAERKQRVQDYVGEWLDDLGALASERMDLLSDFARVNWFYAAWEVDLTKESFAPATKRLEPEQVQKAFKRLRDELLNLQPHEWTAPRLEEIGEAILADYEWTKKKDKTAFLQAIRVALSGRTFTPPIWDTLAVMERYTVQHRLDSAILELGKR